MNNKSTTAIGMFVISGAHYVRDGATFLYVGFMVCALLSLLAGYLHERSLSKLHMEG